MARSSDVEYKMRMTQDLKEKIVDSAKEHNRSMNADIVARLEESFNQPEFDKRMIYFSMAGFFLGLRSRYLEELSQLNLKLKTTTDEEEVHKLNSEIFKNKILLKETNALIDQGDYENTFYREINDNAKRFFTPVSIDDHESE